MHRGTMLNLRWAGFIIVAAALLTACDLSSSGSPSAPSGASETPPPAVGSVRPPTRTKRPPTPTRTKRPAPPTRTRRPASPTRTPKGPTPTSTSTAISGSPLAYGSLSLAIPAGLAASTTNTTSYDVEFPYINPGYGDMPQHVKVVLHGYPVQSTFLAPQVLVFPASEYAQYSEATYHLIAALQHLKYVDGQPLPTGIPSGTFSAQGRAVTFANGSGLRYLTQFDESPLPVNNQELIYYFHGLTTDGSSYVQVILPVTAEFLPADGKLDTRLPYRGVPFNMDQPDLYFQQIADKLNATPPDKFTPSLAVLDALVESISIH